MVCKNFNQSRASQYPSFGGLKPNEYDDQALANSKKRKGSLFSNLPESMASQLEALNRSCSLTSQTKCIPMLEVDNPKISKVTEASPMRTDSSRENFIKLSLESLKKNSSYFNVRAIREIVMLINRIDIEYNVIGEDVQLLTILFYNGLHFHCDVCKVVCSHPSTMEENHLKSSLHVANVSKLNGGTPHYGELLFAPFSNAFFTNDTVRKAFNALFDFKPSKDFKNHFEYGTKSTLLLHSDPQSASLIMEHQSDRLVIVKDKYFESFYGEGFIKPVTGFHCDLCRVFITQGSTDLIAAHLCSLSHQKKLKNKLLQLNPGDFDLANGEIFRTFIESRKPSYSATKSNCDMIKLPFDINKEQSNNPICTNMNSTTNSTLQLKNTSFEIQENKKDDGWKSIRSNPETSQKSLIETDCNSSENRSDDNCPVELIFD